MPIEQTNWCLQIGGQGELFEQLTLEVLNPALGLAHSNQRYCISRDAIVFLYLTVRMAQHTYSK
jgi:hypothetical protein